MSIQIEEGKYYKDGYDAKIGPMYRYSKGPYAWAGKDHETHEDSTFTGKGIYYLHQSTRRDIVAEWVDEPLSGFTADEVRRMSDSVVDRMVADHAPSVTKKSVLETALQTVADRGVPYGGVEDNFNRIAALWSAHTVNRYETGLKFDAADVAVMMALMKIARLEANPSHADSWVDVAGYAACGGEIGAKMAVDAGSQL